MNCVHEILDCPMNQWSALIAIDNISDVAHSCVPCAMLHNNNSVISFIVIDFSRM